MALTIKKDIFKIIMEEKNGQLLTHSALDPGNGRTYQYTSWLCVNRCLNPIKNYLIPQWRDELQQISWT